MLLSSSPLSSNFFSCISQYIIAVAPSITKIQFTALEVHQLDINRKKSKGQKSTFTNKSSMPSKNALILVIFTLQKYKNPG